MTYVVGVRDYSLTAGRLNSSTSANIASIADKGSLTIGEIHHNGTTGGGSSEDQGLVDEARVKGQLLRKHTLRGLHHNKQRSNACGSY